MTQEQNMAEDQLLTISAIAVDPTMADRVAAAYAKEATPGPDLPTAWAFANAYWWAAAPGWAVAWDSAIAGGIPDPGADPAVITDGMILAQVQAMLAPPGT
jgi:hypothetical protein